MGMLKFSNFKEQMIARFRSSSENPRMVSSPKWTTWSGHARASLYQDPRTPGGLVKKFRLKPQVQVLVSSEVKVL